MELVASYPYADENGNLIFTKHRYEELVNGDRKKTFLIEPKLGESTLRPLYNLPAVASSDVVLFVEGEKCVETLRGLGYVAVSAFLGSNSPWMQDYSRNLTNKHVYIIPDNDEPGRKYCNVVYAGLQGYAKSVKIINLPVSEKGDIVDYIEAGHTKEDLDELIVSAEEIKPKKSNKLKLSDGLKEPAATQSEKLILGAVMNGTSEFTEVEELKPEEFFHRDHRIIFDAITRLYNEIGVCDVKAVAQYLADQEKLEDIGGITFLMDLISDMPSVYDLDGHIDQIRSKADSRSLIENMNHAASRLILGENVDEVKAELIDRASGVSTSKAILTHDVTDIVGDDIDAFLKPKTMGITCDLLPSFFDCCFGFHPGQLVIIGGKSGHGKSSLASQIIMYAAGKYNIITELLSFEVPKEEALLKMCCQIAKVSYINVIRGNISDAEREVLTRCITKMKEKPLRINDRNEWTVGKLRNHLKQRKAAGEPVRLLVIDYLQLMSGDPNEKRRDLQLGAITKGLKGMAIEFGMTVILLSQLNRNGDKEQREPVMGDLKETGSAEHDPDIVIFVHLMKQDEDSQDGEDRDAKLILAKQRNGPIRDFKVHFKKAFAYFYEG